MIRCLRVALVLALVSCGSHEASPPPPAPEPTAAYDSQDDSKNNTGAVAMDEGQTITRTQALDEARGAGVLGATGDSQVYGGLGAGQGGGGGGRAYGTIGHGTGTGNGYGVGGGRGGMARMQALEATALKRATPKVPSAGWVDTSKDHLSTFGADVDTASYTYARRMLDEGALPEKDTVRPEEFINYFGYAAPAPSQGPFGAAVDVTRSPLDPSRYVMRVQLATKPIAKADRKPAHLVFLVDVSGSMSSEDRLPLAKQSLHILTENLGDKDTVAIVTYAGATQVVLPVTPATRKADIDRAIDKLRTGGGTAMGSGLDLAYDEAMKGVEKGAVSRVIVCTDGDANLGKHTRDEMLGIIADRAKAGVMLSAVGFGRGNYKDAVLEHLADKGNGNFSYIDSVKQARRVFGDQLGGTLEVVGKDTKLQVDFDPGRVSKYRLIGYEDRDIADADFRNDKVDAGEVGAGHQVTAIYEVELAKDPAQSAAPIATLRVRYKAPDGDTATEVQFPAPSAAVELADTTADVRWAVAVATFAEMMRDGKLANAKPVRELAAGAAGRDAERADFVRLMDLAMKLAAKQT